MNYKDPAAPTNHDHLAALAAHMAYRLAAPVSDNSRIYRNGKGSPTALPRTLEATQRKMAEGWISDNHKNSRREPVPCFNRAVSQKLDYTAISFRLLPVGYPKSYRKR